MRLSSAAVGRVTGDVTRYSYDRDGQAAGIVHFGIGAFHRAHQAWYTDRAMDGGDRDWAIQGVSLRSPDVAAQLNPQDGLYALAERSEAGETIRVIGAVRRALVATHETNSVVDAVASRTAHLVSFTITEKGYCRAADGGLDFNVAGSGSFYPLIAEALRRRRAAGLPGLTLLSCDNLAENGKQLSRLLTEYLERRDPTLRSWFESECACPSTMVDRIVPATTPVDRARVSARVGLDDEAAVVTEPFSQWVIQDGFAGPRPRWEAVGAQIVSDVAAYETAKLRLLNGAHSALAYLGLARGHSFVHEAVADPEIRPIVERLMRDEAGPTISAASGLDLDAYVAALLARFANPALEHRLIQIAMDGSQKIPQRWLATVAENRAQGRSSPAVLTGVKAWLRHIRGDNADRWGSVDDPLAPTFHQLFATRSSEAVVEELFGRGGRIETEWTPTDADRAELAAALS